MFFTLYLLYFSLESTGPQSLLSNPHTLSSATAASALQHRTTKFGELSSLKSATSPPSCLLKSNLINTAVVQNDKSTQKAIKKERKNIKDQHISSLRPKITGSLPLSSLSTGLSSSSSLPLRTNLTLSAAHVKPAASSLTTALY